MMKKKLIGRAAGAIGLLSLLVVLVYGQVNPVATLTIHGYQEGVVIPPGITVSGANAEIGAIQVWIDQDSCTFSIPGTSGASWSIIQQFVTQGYSYCFARASDPKDYLRSGQLLDISYTGTDTCSMVQSGTFQTNAQFYDEPAHAWTSTTTTLAGTLLPMVLPGVTFTLHTASPARGYRSGIDMTGPADTLVTSFSITLNIPLDTLDVALSTDIPFGAWFDADSVYGDANSTTIEASVTDTSFAMCCGHIVDISLFAATDTFTITAATATHQGLSFNVTTEGSLYASDSTMIRTVANPTAVQFRSDKGKSGVYPATFPDSIYTRWQAPGYLSGGPVFVKSARSISVIGEDGPGTSTDSTLIAVRVDSTGTLVWETALPDTNDGGYSWPIGATATYVYGMRINDGLTENPIYACSLGTGGIGWVTATTHCVSAGRLGPQPFTILNDGDIICHDWQDASAPALVRIDAADGSIDWSAIIPDNIIEPDTLGFMGALSTVAYNYNGTEYIAVMCRDGIIDIFQASDGTYVSHQADFERNDFTELFMASNSAFGDTLTPPVLLLTGRPNNPTTQNTFMYAHGYIAGIDVKPIDSIEWIESTQRAPNTMGGFAYAWTDTITGPVYFGPFTMLPGSSNRALVWNVPTRAENKTLIYRDNGNTSGNLQFMSDRVHKVIVAEPGAGWMHCLKNITTPIDPSTPTPATHVWSIYYPSSPHSSIWAQDKKVFLNAGNVWACYALKGTQPPSQGGHGGKDQEVEP